MPSALPSTLTLPALPSRNGDTCKRNWTGTMAQVNHQYEDMSNVSFLIQSWISWSVYYSGIAWQFTLPLLRNCVPQSVSLDSSDERGLLILPADRGASCSLRRPLSSSRFPSSSYVSGGRRHPHRLYTVESTVCTTRGCGAMHLRFRESRTRLPLLEDWMHRGTSQLEN